MAAPGKLPGNTVGDRLFELKDAAIGEEARNLGRLLRVETAIENLGYEMRVSRGLVGVARDAERHDGPPLFQHHRGNDRVHRPFSGCNRIGVTRTDTKTVAAV